MGTKNCNPRKFVQKRGLARIEVLALKDDIQAWLSKGFSPMVIFKMYLEAKKISDSYSYETFRRALCATFETQYDRSARNTARHPAALNLESMHEMDDSGQLMPFAFEDALVRAIRDELGVPWFVARDVCNVLGLENPRTSLALLDEDEKGVHSVDTLGGTQAMTVVSESGLYSLIFRSRKPQARAFRKWVTSEVLPAIRRTGRYAAQTSLPDDLASSLPPDVRAQLLACAVEAAKMEKAGPEVVEIYFQHYCQLVCTNREQKVKQ